MSVDKHFWVVFKPCRNKCINFLWLSRQNRLNVVQMVQKCQCNRLLITIGMMWITYECMLYMCTYSFWSHFVCICYLSTTHLMIIVIAWQSIEISCLYHSIMSIYLDLLSWRAWNNFSGHALDTKIAFNEQYLTIYQMESTIISLGL